MKSSHPDCSKLPLVSALPMTVGLLLALDVQPAWAYIDPGSGSILMQVVLGGTAGLAVLARVAWQRVRASLNSSRQHAPSTTATPRSHDQ